MVRSNAFRFALLLAASLSLGTAAWSQAASVVAKPKPLEDYRQFAMTKEGDAGRGRLLFLDEVRLGCAKCHSLDGRGTKAGPDLATVGDQFARRDLIDAVLSPSARLAVGYSTTVVETKSGDQHQGVLKQATDNWIELMGGDGQRLRLSRQDIAQQRGSEVSLMPEGLQAGLSLPEFSDLIEYLVSLKQADHASTRHHGMPEHIPVLTRPVALRPFLRESLRAGPAAEKLVFPTQSGLIWFGQIPGQPELFLAAHQSGKVWMLDKGSGTEIKSVFADFTPETFSARGPNGVLGLAFHPKCRENRKYYLKHQVFEEGKIATVLEERLIAPDWRRDSGQPARRLLKIVSVAEHHNGGCIEFGPDGFLYLGMGDSAPNFDPQGYGQDLRLLFGKMLRLDVDHQDPDRAYAIPQDNPFRQQPGARPEIWARGLREPWRFSFDPLTGDLWVADLGQERGDEIDLVRRGENYGWNVFEGFELFSAAERREGAAYVPPIFSTRRSQGTCLIGGRVYRGDKNSSFHGVYVFGDHQSKRIWGLTQENRSLRTVHQLATSPQSITAFATDERGRMFVIGYEGMVYELDFTPANFHETAPTASAAAVPGR